MHHALSRETVLGWLRVEAAVRGFDARPIKLIDISKDVGLVRVMIRCSVTGNAIPPDSASAVMTTARQRRLYRKLGFADASSHSGRRTFITQVARKIIQCGGSLRDVQELAGHASLATTQGYIAGDAEAKRRVVASI
jgi:integrase/recombinase XerD